MAESMEVVLARIDERVKAIDEKLDNDREDIKDHEKRIRLNERIRNFAIGGLAISGGGWSITEWFL